MTWADTGQVFTDEAVDRAFAYTKGQSWLVNALATEAIGRIVPPAPISAVHIEDARGRLVSAGALGLQWLVEALHEPRVRRLVVPMITGGVPELDEEQRDGVAYVRDLGLVAQGKAVRVANPIYRDVLVRNLGQTADDAGHLLRHSRFLPDR